MKKGPFKMKGFSGFGNSPIEQDKMARVEKAKKTTTKTTGEIPFPDLKDHGDGTYSFDASGAAGDGYRLNITQSEYNRALELNKKHSSN